MPQASAHSKSYTVPYGRGSLCYTLLEARARAMTRATKVNAGMTKRLESYTHMMSRHQDAEYMRTEKVLRRLQQTIIELEAYRRVITDMRVEHFTTMKLGFSPRDVRTHSAFKRCQTEKKVMNIGFSVQSLYPQVLQLLEDTDPAKLREEERQLLLTDARKLSDFTIDRRITDAAKKREQIMSELSDIQSIMELKGHGFLDSNKNKSGLFPDIVSKQPSTFKKTHKRANSESGLTGGFKAKPLLASKSHMQ